MSEARAEARLPFGNMRFRVEIEDLPESGVVEVIFPEARIAAQPRETGAAHYGSLIIRRGLTLLLDWYEWWDEARRSERPPARAIRVTLRDVSGNDASSWVFRDAVPVAYQLSPLSALGNEAVFETLELTVGGFEAGRSK